MQAWDVGEDRVAFENVRRRPRVWLGLCGGAAARVPTGCGSARPSRRRVADGQSLCSAAARRESCAGKSRYALRFENGVAADGQTSTSADAAAIAEDGAGKCR